MIISIASGKGGTGKTTLATSIALYAANKGFSVNIIDADVEEPNVNLFLNYNISYTDEVNRTIPAINQCVCIGCDKCQSICQFNCIVKIKNEMLIFPELCHSCGGCNLVCETGAITNSLQRTGEIEIATKENIKYIGGRLDIKQALAPPVISAAKNHIERENNSLNIIDAPPGTACPAIEAIKGSNYVILVTDATPFGLSDLKLAVETVRNLNYKFGVVINRADFGENEIYKYCQREQIDIIAEFPNSLAIATAYSNGNVAEYITEHFYETLNKILNNIGFKFLAEEKL